MPLPILRDLVSAGGACAAGGFLSWAAAAPSSQIFGPTIRHTGNPETIALTFDDGPNPLVTPKLLDLLDRHQARATFFVIGKWAAAEPGLTREIFDRGHLLANHTHSHPRLALCSRERIDEELRRCDDAIESATGRRSHWMRPPFGYRSPLVAQAVRDRGDEGIVMWSASAWDWRIQPEARLIGRLGAVRGGDIVLLHDGDHRVARGDREHTSAAVAHWLPRWKEAGLNFVTVQAAVSE
jgi:peptidoglycan-N-acetylglucosamine deacetylase